MLTKLVTEKAEDAPEHIPDATFNAILHELKFSDPELCIVLANVTLGHRRTIIELKLLH